MSSFGAPEPNPNPYSSPATGPRPGFIEPPSSNDPPIVVTKYMLEMLRQTKPWVRFMSVMGFLGAALMMILGAFMIILGATTRGGPPAFVGIIYIPLGLIYLGPSVFLWRYANAIAELLQSRIGTQLENALQAQKSFWKFVGIMAAVILVLYALIFVFAIAGGVFMGARNAGS